VAQGTFRDDLYYRIKVVELLLPALRERGPEDLERLARHFVASASKRHRLAAPRLTPAAVDRLRAYHWPGNVRELENCIESAVVLCEGEILPEHLPLPELQKSARSRELPTVSEGRPLTLAEVERHHVLHLLERSRNNRTLAAKWLGIGRNTLGRKLKEYGISDEEPPEPLG
jgi:Nif-specific regulatory protein